MPDYLPFAKRKPDSQYENMLRDIVYFGELVDTKQGSPAYTIMGYQQRYRMENGFPITPLRAIGGFYQKAIGELCAFINGARTLDELESFGCDWWGAWASEEKCAARGLSAGDLGPGSYGHAYRNFTTSLDPDDQGFDQMEHVIAKLKDLPNDRTAVVTTWNPVMNQRQDGVKSKNTIAPCHGSLIHFRVLNGKLHLVHVQRSGDVPVGVPSNMTQYAALGLMVEHLTGYEFVEYVHYLSDAHVYQVQEQRVREMIQRVARCLPTVVLNEAGRQVTDIHDFRGEHFELSDYHPHPAIRDIPVLT